MNLSDHNTLTLCFVDDHNLVRKGLIKLVEARNTNNKYRILFEAENGVDFQEKLKTYGTPNIVFMDVDMPKMDGYQTVKWIRSNLTNIKIIVVTMFDSEETVIRMIRHGIDGYITKDLEVDDMHKALEQVAQGKGFYPPFVAKIMAENIGRITAAGVIKTGPLAGVSDRERTFLQFVPSDLTYDQIAHKMHVSPKTIDFYRKSLFEKFGVKSRQGLTSYLYKNGILK
jgi:DNA-binding NarL/FixJ family response regulator